MAIELKSIRLTLQESVEDDTTGKGSNSRVAMAVVITVFVVCLLACVAAHLYLPGKNLESLINSFILALTSAAGIPYTAQKITTAIANRNTPGTGQG